MTGIKTVVIGIGNTLLTDEGVGVRAVDAIRPFFDSDTSIEFIDGGTLSFTLINYFNQSDNLIIIDASNLQLEPGSIKVFQNDEVLKFLKCNKPQSVHDVNLFDVLSTARLMDRYPKKLALIAVQPKTMRWGTHLSQIVEKALPKVNQHVNELHKQWNINDEFSYPNYS